VIRRQPLIYINHDNDNANNNDHYTYTPSPTISEQNDELVAASLIVDIDDFQDSQEDLIYAQNDDDISFHTHTLNNDPFDEILAQTYEEEDNENVINNIRNEDAINEAIIDEAVARALQDDLDLPISPLPVPTISSVSSVSSVSTAPRLSMYNHHRRLLAHRIPVDVDRMSYEQLLALDENVKKHGLTKSETAALQIIEFKSTMKNQTCCSICMVEFEVREKLRLLPCSHYYHKECIDKWLSENRTCPICKRTINERSTKKN